MKEAFGGTFMIYVFLIFLVTYIIFIGVALNYAKAFRVKNKVIDIIEQSEGIRKLNDTSDETLTKINAFMGNLHYKVSNDTEGITENDCKKAFRINNNTNLYINKDRGYCIRKIAPEGTNGIYPEYYQVATFVDIYIPFVELHFLIPIKGETRKIERITT